MTMTPATVTKWVSLCVVIRASSVQLCILVFNLCHFIFKFIFYSAWIHLPLGSLLIPILSPSIPASSSVSHTMKDYDRLYSITSLTISNWLKMPIMTLSCTIMGSARCKFAIFSTHHHLGASGGTKMHKFKATSFQLLTWLLHTPKVSKNYSVMHLIWASQRQILTCHCISQVFIDGAALVGLLRPGTESEKRPTELKT